MEEAADRLEASLFTDGRQAVDDASPRARSTGLKPAS
jgi:hypothetical protein